ncbi:MAG: diphthamide synthesis protein [Nanoarchaeota archaeon]
MEERTIKQLEEKYELELDKIIKEIQKTKPKKILLQLPDGLKPYATAITDYIKNNANIETDIFIWLGSCFGACDLPNSDAELIIQFGHAPWK